AWGPLKRVANIGAAHFGGGLAANRHNDVTRADTSSICRSSNKRCDNNNFVVAWADRHPNAVVLAALIFSQERVRLGIEEVGVGIEHVQHARDGAVVNGLVGVYRFGIVLLDDVVNGSELAQAVADVGIAARGCSGIDLLPEDHS